MQVALVEISLDRYFVALTTQSVKVIQLYDSEPKTMLVIAYKAFTELDSTAGFKLDHLACYSTTACFVYSFSGKLYYYFNPLEQNPYFKKVQMLNMPANIKKCLHIARGKYLLFLDRSGLISTLCNHKSHQCQLVSLTSADCDNVVDVKASSNGFDQDFRRVMLAVQCKNRNTVIIYFSTSAKDLPLLDLVNSAVQLAVIAPKNQYSNILLGFQNDTKHLLIAEDTTDKLTIYFYEKTPCNPNCLTCSSTSLLFRSEWARHRHRLLCSMFRFLLQSYKGSESGSFRE